MKLLAMVTALLFIGDVAVAATVPQRPGVPQLEINPKIEMQLRHNSPALYRKLGIYRIMRRARLQNVNGGEQAYCVGKTMGHVKAGCYIEFYYTKARYNSPRLWEKNDLCGVDARFYARWDQPNHYVPLTGGARWLRKGNLRAVLYVVNDQWRMCHLDI